MRIAHPSAARAVQERREYQTAAMTVGANEKHGTANRLQAYDPLAAQSLRHLRPPSVQAFRSKLTFPYSHTQFGWTMSRFKAVSCSMMSAGYSMTSASSQSTQSSLRSARNRR